MSFRPVIDLINRYQDLYSDDIIYVHGGFAVHLYIKEKLNIEIPVRDIDIEIRSRVTIHEFHDRLRQLIPGCSPTHLVGITTIQIGNISTDWFYEEYTSSLDIAVIEDIPVRPLSVVYAEEVSSLQSITDEMILWQQEVAQALSIEPLTQEILNRIDTEFNPFIDWCYEKQRRKFQRLPLLLRVMNL